MRRSRVRGGCSPSDLALVDLTQGEIERLERDYGTIEDILPLSPLQEGLLFHALYDAAGPDVYTVQLELELEGALEPAVLEASLQAVIGRHASLRSGFRHEQLGRPVQVVLPRVAAPWRLIDLSGLRCGRAAGAAEARFCEADRLERFDLAAPPLMRFALIRLAAERHRLLISNHHLLMDGWSAPILVRELLEVYAAGRQRGLAAAGHPLPRLSGVDCPAGPCRGAVGLAGEPGRSRGGHAACGAADAGGSGGPQRGGAAAVAPEQIELSLGGALSADLNRTARELALTLNTVLQTAWGILLGRLTGRADVVFGVTVAGRPAELAGVEQMVGLFINTLPLRMALPPQLPLSELLRQTQERQSRLMAHQHLGLCRDPAGGGPGRAVRHAHGV